MNHTRTNYLAFGFLVSIKSISTGLVPKFFSDRLSPKIHLVEPVSM